MDKGVNLKTSDNKYCFALKYETQATHKYSDGIFTLLKSVQIGMAYEC